MMSVLSNYRRLQYFDFVIQLLSFARNFPFHAFDPFVKFDAFQFDVLGFLGSSAPRTHGRRGGGGGGGRNSGMFGGHETRGGPKLAPLRRSVDLLSLVFCVAVVGL